MPGSNLTRVEAEARKAIVEAPIHYHVDLDLTVGPKNFGSKALICFNAKPGSSTFLDLIADEVTAIELNGKSLDPATAFQDNRIELTDLKEKNEVTVEALCRYSNTGEGLHRSVDPSDGNIYLYSQFEVPDARRVYAVFDQPDLKATFDFKVLAPASWIVTSNMPVATIELPTTHPIVAPINDLNDTYVNFDGITYAKGASVLKQLVFYVGRERFFEGIHNYLIRHAYSNATLADLLGELEKTSGRDLKAWSAKWLEESGINTIAADIKANANGTIAELKLTQSAPAEHPVLRPHRLAIGFYNEDAETGKIVRTEQFELDVDGETTIVEAAAGKQRPAFVLINDDDLTYTKIRFDAESQAFAEANLQRFDDALARAVTWLAFWDMTRDGEFPAERFVDMTLRLLATETESTTFRYALACMSTTAHHYVAPARREEVLRHVAAELWTLTNAAEAGSDTQFQLATAYLGYGEEGDAAFAANARGLLDGTVTLDGLDIDNNFTWTIVQSLTSVNEMTNEDVDAQLAKKDTTENREFAYGARASMATVEAKEWAWDQALHNDELTNSQLEAVARGFSTTPRADLVEPFAAKYFETVDWVWANKTYHMAEALLNGLYPGYADPATLTKLGDAWLEEHIAADNALKRLIVENVASSHRTLKVREYNEAL